MKRMEKEIVNKFIIKSKQERILWELENPKKRDEVFWKLSGPNLLKKNCIQEIGYLSEREMEEYLFQLGKSTEIYFLGESFIGELSLKEAVKKANMGEICIIYCGGGIGYYQGEQDIGKPPRFLLISND